MNVLYRNFFLCNKEGLWNMGVKDGIIEFLEGDSSFNRDLINFSRIYDLERGYLLPGFSDPHMHFSIFSIFVLSVVDLNNIKSIEELKGKVKQDIKDTITVGWGFDHEIFKEKRLPTIDDLDEVSTEIPIIIYRFDGHLCVVNSKLLEICNINRESINPEGGIIGRFDDGRLNGILLETAIPTKTILNIPEILNSLKDNFLVSQEILLSLGITSVSDMGIGFNTLKVYRDLEKSGKIKIRISLYLDEECLQYPQRVMEELNYGDLVRIKGIKIIADGTLGSKSAALFDSYSDDPGNKGFLRIPIEKLTKYICKADEMGLQVSVHAIGDRALSEVINAFSKVKNRELRHRIEHIQICNDDLLNKLKEMDIVAVIQPIFIKSDLLWAESRLGKDRVNNSYRLKSLIDKKIVVAASSDCPVETAAPFLGIFFSVSHRDLEDREFPEWVKRERITIEDAIKLYTEGAAFALSEKKGKIEVGQIADFIVLPENPLKIGIERIKDLNVLKTIINGEPVYPAENA